jgi:acyl dehydratase
VAGASLSTAELRVILDTMTTRTIDGINGLKAAVGEHLGYSPWLEITQERVNQFAEATGDFQWIHVDVERAKAESPFGGPIAHGYLTLSLLPSLMPKVVQTSGFSMGVNCNRVRFMSPVPVGANVRLGLKLVSVDDIAGGAQMVYEATFEVEGSEKPSCVAEVVLRSYV